MPLGQLYRDKVLVFSQDSCDWCLLYLTLFSIRSFKYQMYTHHVLHLMTLPIRTWSITPIPLTLSTTVPQHLICRVITKGVIVPYGVCKTYWCLKVQRRRGSAVYNGETLERAASSFDAAVTAGEGSTNR